MRQEHADACQVPLVRRVVESGVAVAVDCRSVCAGGEQAPHHLDVAKVRGEVKRRLGVQRIRIQATAGGEVHCALKEGKHSIEDRQIANQDAEVQRIATHVVECV